MLAPGLRAGVFPGGGWGAAAGLVSGGGLGSLVAYIGTRAGIRPALWIMLGPAVGSGALLCTRALLAERDLPGQPPPNHAEFTRRKFVTNLN